MDRLNQQGIKAVRLSWRFRVDPILLVNMIKLIRSDPPQIVHTHLFKSDFHGRLAARLCGVPVVVSTLHNCDAWANNPVFGLIYGLTALFADKIIAVADEVKKFALEHLFIRESRIVTIRNAIQVDQFRYDDQARFNVRKEFGLSLDVLLFGIVARLDPQKDHENFLHAAALIKKEAPAARFLIVGDGGLRDSLVKLADDLGLTPDVVFCGMRKDMPAIMSAIDVLVLSSRYEGLPVVLLEAMAASRPVVSTSVNGVPGVVIDGETGLLVPSANSEALAEACMTLAGDHHLRQEMGLSGFQRVRALYSIELMIQSTIDLYAQLMRQHGVQ